MARAPPGKFSYSLFDSKSLSIWGAPHERSSRGRSRPGPGGRNADADEQTTHARFSAFRYAPSGAQSPPRAGRPTCRVRGTSRPGVYFAAPKDWTADARAVRPRADVAQERLRQAAPAGRHADPRRPERARRLLRSEVRGGLGRTPQAREDHDLRRPRGRTGERRGGNGETSAMEGRDDAHRRHAVRRHVPAQGPRATRSTQKPNARSARSARNRSRSGCERAGVSILYSEDLSDGRRYGELRVAPPASGAAESTAIRRSHA